MEDRKLVRSDESEKGWVLLQERAGPMCTISHVHDRPGEDKLVLLGQRSLQGSNNVPKLINKIITPDCVIAPAFVVDK